MKEQKPSTSSERTAAPSRAAKRAAGPEPPDVLTEAEARRRLEMRLDAALDMTFPASDPVALGPSSDD